jgi:hypothetical protein
LDSKLYQLIWSPLITNYTHELMTAKQNTDNRHLKFWHWKKVRSTSEKVKKWQSEKMLTLALKSFWLIYKSSNFSKYFGVDVINYTYRSQRAKFQYWYWYRRNYSEVLFFRSGNTCRVTLVLYPLNINSSTSWHK